jgi:hypothetical protein
MVTALTFDIPIGTTLLANDGFSHELGQICDIESTRWGQHYVVVMADGSLRTVHSLKDDCNSTRIGWSVASPDWIARLTA